MLTHLKAAQRSARLTIQPADSVPTNHQQIDKRPQSLGQPDLGAFHVVPLHRNLDRGQAPPPGDEQILNVEAESVQSLTLKDLPRRVPPVELEAALRVRKGKPRDDAHQQVKNDSGQL